MIKFSLRPRLSKAKAKLSLYSESIGSGNYSDLVKRASSEFKSSRTWVKFRTIGSA